MINECIKYDKNTIDNYRFLMTYSTLFWIKISNGFISITILSKKFIEKERNARYNKIGGSQEIKSMVQGHIQNVSIHYIHVIDKKLKSCDGFGRPKKVIDLRTLTSDYYYYYIKHYYSKSTEEFVEKLMKSDAVHNNTLSNKMYKIKRYFRYNSITKQKLDLIQNKTKLDLSFFRSKIH